ncbi:Cytochrome P450 [Amanita muscaria]
MFHRFGEPLFRIARSIPAIGPSGVLSSYIGTFRFLRHGRDMLKEGYEKFYGSIFKIPTLTSWVVVVTSGPLIDELRRAPEDFLSAFDAVRDAFLTDLTVGPETFLDPFHIDVIKGPLTRNIGTKFADVQDEIAVAFDEDIPFKGDEWSKVTVYSTLLDIVARTSNRMLVGFPLCRNSDWIELNKRYTMNVMKSAMILGLVPPALRPIVAPLLRGLLPRDIKCATRLIEPLIQQRLEQEVQHGTDWPDKPNDIITWTLDVTRDKPRSLRAIIIAILGVNFAAIHTTTLSVTFVLFELATRPEYVQPLRDEIEAVIKEEGWSIDSVRKLRKLDSFIKECMRVSNFALVIMGRKARKDFTFSDGTTIPAGSTVVVPFNPVHTDKDKYVNPDKFDGFRFERLRAQEGEETKHQLLSLGVDYVLFGHGRHACPGRFFVINEIKVMLAHLLLNYDIKMADGGGRPKDWQFGIFTGPDTNAKILFRKRRT